MAEQLKEDTAEEKVEKKVKSKLSPYEWRILKSKIRNVEVKNGLKNKFSNFQREFRIQLATFVTGAFAFVAALLWRDAIKSFLDKYQEILIQWVPLKEDWFVQFYTAFFVTIIAVISILAITKFIKPREK